MGGDVGGGADLVLVAVDQHAILGQDEVGLDEVRALRHRQAVAAERMLRPLAGRAAISDEQRRNGRPGGRLAD